MVVTILVTLGILAVLILVHELGHFAAARFFDIRAPRFSIGLGPKVFGFQRGETEYRLSAFPLGGYVKIAGLEEMDALEGGADEDGDTDPSRTFEAKSAPARAAVLSAGVAMNALLAVVLFAVVAGVWGVPVPPDPVVGNVVEEWVPPSAAALATIRPGSRITRVGDRPVENMDQVARALMAARSGPLTLRFANRPPLTVEIPRAAVKRQFLPMAIEPVSRDEAILGNVADGGPAARAGLRPGDRIVAVGGAPVKSWQQVENAVDRHPGEKLTVQLERDGATRSATLTPETDWLGSYPVGRMGASRAPGTAGPGPRERKGPIAAMGWGVSQSWDMVTLIGQFVAGLFDGRHSARELGGPILIGQLSGATARAGLPVLLMFVAMLSINLAVINLLPIPALDGGHLLFLLVEVVRGRPAPRRVRVALGKVGVALVAMLMVWAVAADVLRLMG